MKSCSGRWITLAILLLATVATAQAGTVRGNVENGTTGKPAPGVELVLIQLQGGMQEVAHSKTDAQGQFSFDNPGLGAQPMLVRAIYHGVNFNEPVPPGSSSVHVEIFEPSMDVKTISVLTHVLIFQPHGVNLIVGEEFQIENKSQPPQAYFRAEGSFDFTLPENARLQQVAAVGPSGMQVVQSPIDKKNNRYAVAFAFRPGQSVVRYSYELPYPGNSATVKIPTVYPAGRFLVVAPPSLQVTGDGLTPSGQQQGMNLYDRQDVPVGTLVAVNVSGTAPLQDPNGGAAQGQQGNAAKQGAELASASIQQAPGRLDTLKLPLIICFIVLFGVAGFLLLRQRVVPVPTQNADEAASLPAPKKSKPAIAPTAHPAVPGATSNGAASLADVDAAVGTSLDVLKDQLFRLELRRQAGTISETEYTQERERAEKVLRDLVRG